MPPRPTPPPATNGTSRQVVPPIAPLPAPAPADLRTEYVSGGGWSWYSRLARALPPSIDDITSDLGDDLYERMELDPTVAKCLSIFKASVLEDGVELSPAVKDETDPDYELAMTIRDEAEAMLEDLETPLDDVLWDMCSHISRGNVVAEQRYDLKRGNVEKRDLLQLVALKVKARRTYAFVVDAYLNVIGLLGQRPGESNPYMGQVGLDPDQTPNILARQKFAIATFRPRNADPRGTSILRPAYDAWQRKRMMEPEFLKYASQFASPSVWATTPQNAQQQPPMDAFANPTLDGGSSLLPPFTPGADLPSTTDLFGQYPPQPNGIYTLSPEQKLLSTLLEFRNGTAAAFVFGTELHVIEMQGKGEAFLNYIARCDRDMIGAILTQSLATEEGEHQARAAAQVHQDVLDTLVRQGKRGMVRMIHRDILRNWVLYNWGEKALHLVPIPTLGHTETQDLAGFMTSVAQLYTSGYLHDSQLPGLDEDLNLPARDLTQDEPLDDDTGGAPGGQAGGGPQPAPDKAAPSKPAPAPVPPNRVNINAHTRGRPAARAKMSDELEPKVGNRPKPVKGVTYSESDKRLILELFDDAFPEAAGLLDAKVQDGR